MSDDENRPDDPEAVRIIGADEAAEVLERDDVARRREPEDPRPGDRPRARPDDAPEPILRFPLPSGEQADATADLPHWTEPPTGQQPGIGGAEDEGADDEWSAFSGGPRWRDQGDDWSEEDDVRSFAGGTSEGGALDVDRPDPEDFFTFDELDAPAPGRSVFDDGAPGEFEGDDDDGEFDDELDDDPRGGRKIVVGGGRITPGPPPNVPRVSASGVGGDRDIGQAAVVGVGFLAVAAVAFFVGPALAAVLVTGIVTFAAAEFFTKLREVGYQPAALLGIVATAGIVLGAYHRGEAAIPVALVLTVAFSMFWYLAGASHGQANLNIGVTLLGVGWIGMFGAFATALLSIQGGEGVGNAGKGILFGAILATVAYDVGGYFVGRSAGRSPLSEASPNKTVEGLLGGCIAAITVAVIYGFLSEPFGSLGDGLTLGIAVAIAAPLGDLCQSMIKRDLGIKDMGAVLPGHGGLLDRFDALLFVLPTVYYAAKLSDFFL